MVSITVAGLVLPGCAEGVADEATPSVVSQPAVSDVVTCSSPRVREPQLCRTVDVGGSTVRYVFAFEGSAPPERAVVIDGGPGRSQLSGAGVTNLLEALPTNLDRSSFTFIVIEEPWVTEAVPESCVVAGRSHLEELAAAGIVRRGRRRMAPVLLRGRWTTGSYTNAVAAIELSSGVDIVGFVGALFGSAAGIPRRYVRRAALAMIADPFPLDGPLDVVLAHQAAGVGERLEFTAGDAVAADVSLASALQTLDDSAGDPSVWKPGRAAAACVPRTVRVR